MFKSFLDAASTGKTSRATTVAGFAGTADECDRVAGLWKELVKPIKEFHACKFFPRTPEGRMSGIYKGLSVKDAEDCVVSLIDLVAGSSLLPIRLAIDAAAFRSLHEDERRWMTATVAFGRSWPSEGAPERAHVAPFYYCLTSLNEYTPAGEQMYVTFDREDGNEATTIRTYNGVKHLGSPWGDKLAESIVHSSRLKAVLLQAADLLAYVITLTVTKAPRNKVALYALKKLAFMRDYVRAMDTEGIDKHLIKCPFRKTFWNGMTEPDFLEQLRLANVEVLAYKGNDGIYLSHYVRREKRKAIYELDLRSLGTPMHFQEDSTRNTRVSSASSITKPHAPQRTSKRHSGGKNS